MTSAATAWIVPEALTATVRVAGLGVTLPIVRSAIELRPRLPTFSGFLPSDSALDSPTTSTDAVFAERSTPIEPRVILVVIDGDPGTGRTWVRIRPPALLTVPLVPSGEMVPPLSGEVNTLAAGVVGGITTSLVSTSLSLVSSVGSPVKTMLPVGRTATVSGSTSETEAPRSMLALNGGFTLTVLTIVLPFFFTLVLVGAGVSFEFSALAPALVSFTFLALTEAPKPRRAVEVPARLATLTVLPPTLALIDLPLVSTVRLFSVTDFFPQVIFRPPLWVMVPAPVVGSISPPVTAKVALVPLILLGLTAVILMPAFFAFLLKAPLMVSVVVPLLIGSDAADASGAMASIATSAAETIATGSIFPLALPSRVDSNIYFLHCSLPPPAVPCGDLRQVD